MITLRANILKFLPLREAERKDPVRELFNSLLYRENIC